MDDFSTLPKTFFDLLRKSQALEDIDTKVLEVYFAEIAEDETLIPELVCVIGPGPFMSMVEYFGGMSMTIPKPEDILRRVKAANKEQENDATQ